jgi:hypothetical protein
VTRRLIHGHRHLPPLHSGSYRKWEKSLPPDNLSNYEAKHGALLPTPMR